MKNKEFWKSDMGRFLITAVCCVAIWGLLLALFMTRTDFGVIAVALVFSYFGWKALSMIQPAMFVWMPIGGWIIYFCVKFLISFVIGIFVAPFVLGRKLSAYIQSLI